MMGSWTQQMGFPMLKVLNDPMQDNADSIEVEQSWFLADGSQEPGDDAKKWHVPVFVGSDKKQLAEAVFVSEKKQTVPLSGAAAGAAWLKLNLGQHVPTRVLYPASMIDRLAANVKSLPVEDRIGLLSDTYALSKAGALDVTALGKLLAGYKGETNEKVWSQLVSVLEQLEKVMKLGLPQAAVDAFKLVASQIVAPAFKEVGWDTAPDDSDNRKKLRSILVGAVAKYCAQDAVIAAEANQKTAAFLQAPADPASLNADVRAAALSIAMEADPDNLYDRLVVAHNAVNDNAIKKDIYSALGGNPKRALRERFLEWGLTDEVRAQDMIYVPLSVLSAGSEGADQVFAWVDNQYDCVYARLGATSMMLFSHIVKISGAGFASKEKAAEVESFWKSKPVFDKIERALSQTVEGILTNAGFVGRLQASSLATPDFWNQL
jgi:aminopeptidase N